MDQDNHGESKHSDLGHRQQEGKEIFLLPEIIDKLGSHATCSILFKLRQTSTMYYSRLNLPYLNRLNKTIKTAGIKYFPIVNAESINKGSRTVQITQSLECPHIYRHFVIEEKRTELDSGPIICINIENLCPYIKKLSLKSFPYRFQTNAGIELSKLVSQFPNLTHVYLKYIHGYTNSFHMSTLQDLKDFLTNVQSQVRVIIMINDYSGLNALIQFIPTDLSGSNNFSIHLDMDIKSVNDSDLYIQLIPSNFQLMEHIHLKLFLDSSNFKTNFTVAKKEKLKNNLKLYSQFLTHLDILQIERKNGKKLDILKNTNILNWPKLRYLKIIGYEHKDGLIEMIRNCNNLEKLLLNVSQNIFYRGNQLNLEVLNDMFKKENLPQLKYLEINGGVNFRSGWGLKAYLKKRLGLDVKVKVVSEHYVLLTDTED